MGNMVSLVDEIRNRLETSRTSGVLTNIKRVFVGDVYEARKQNEFPTISIFVESGLTTDIYKRNGNSDEIIVVIHLVERNLSTITNTIYKTSDQTGFLYTLEDVLNVIDKNTSGAQDLTLSGNAYRLKNVSWDITTDDTLINCKISLEISTCLFQIGGR